MPFSYMDTGIFTPGKELPWSFGHGEVVAKMQALAAAPWPQEATIANHGPCSLDTW